MIELEDVPPLRGPRPAGTERVRRRPPEDEGARFRPARRGLLAGLAAAGATAGLNAIGVLPPARQALAEGFSLSSGYYDILPYCPPGEPHVGCSPGCGPSLVCSSCCRTSGKYKGYHRSGVSDPHRYKLRPNQCYGGKWDGWIWKVSKSCGNCRRGVTWRCHDGWKKSSGGSWYKTICRKAVACYN